jgi:hypothetical protein
MDLNSCRKVALCSQFRNRKVSEVAATYGPFFVINDGPRAAPTAVGLARNLRFRRLEIRVRVPENVLLRLSRLDPSDDQHNLVFVLEDAGFKLAFRFAPKLEQPGRLLAVHNFLYTPRK